ncbi:MAG: chemotaxis protein CheB [Pseudomonadota bacterium]
MVVAIADEPEIGNKSQLDFPIVAIGASAGGLEAVTQMFHNVEPGTGIAFVLVMHLDPNHESMMAELLSSKTRLNVRQIADNDHLEVDCLHVIPPGSSLTIENGKFKLDPFSEPRGLRRPIDSFFSSVARIQGEKAACVILSGTGADGTAGLHSIKEFGGVCAVQSPEEARYDGMPASAISTDLVDFVLGSDQIVGRLQGYFDGALKSQLPLDEKASEPALQSIFAVLREGVGVDFSGYKRSTLLRRLRRRMQVLEIAALQHYIDHLSSEEAEQKALARDFLINVTSFFRDVENFELARKLVLTPLLKQVSRSKEVRIWVPGCSSGQEAYTIAMMVAETCEELDVRPLVQIFATDVDEVMIEHARQASYPVSTYTEIPAKYRERYTIATEERFEIAPEVRRLVRFSVHNIIQNPPFSKIDFISCRNLLIYLGEQLQSEVFPLLHFSLRPGGNLLLGTSESVIRSSDLFLPVDQHARIFRRNDTARRVHVNLPLGSTSRDGVIQRGIGKLASETDFPRHQSFDASNATIFEHYAPPFVRVTTEGRIIDSSGDFSLFIEARPGDDRSLGTLARDGLAEVIGPLASDAIATGERKSLQGLSVTYPFGTQKTDIIAHPMKDETAAVIFLASEQLKPVVDQFAVKPISRDQRISDLQDELKSLKLELKSKVEEIETANEELKSSNEEMMSMNEELQSANEELTTANEELKNKIDELTLANADLDNFLQSADLSMIVLDRDCRIRHITNAARQNLPLQRSDEGRSLAEFNLPVAGIAIHEEVQKVIETGHSFECTTSPNSNGQSFFLRITPYFFASGVVEGASITLLDISNEEELRRDLADETRKLRLAMDAANMGSWETNLETGDMIVDEVAAELAGLDRHGAISRAAFFKHISPEDVGKFSAIGEASSHDEQPYSHTARIDHPEKGTRWMRVHAKPYQSEDGSHWITGLGLDITEIMQLQEELKWESEKLRNALQTARMGVAEYDPETLETTADAILAEQLSLDGPGTYSPEELQAYLFKEDIPKVESALTHASETGEEYEIDYGVAVPGEEPRHFRTRGFLMANPNGRKKIVAPTFDVTAIRYQQLLVEEMSHRIKNLFAVVGGLIQAAPKENPAAHQMACDLLDRVVSLGRVYDLARKEAGSAGVTLGDLLRSITEPHSTSQDLSIQGPEVMVDNETVNTLTLIVHELTTNAAKYGALSHKKGKLHIGWECDQESGVTINWIEETPGFSPTKSDDGSGKTLIDSGVRQLKGSFSRTYAATGAEIEIRLQL